VSPARITSATTRWLREHPALWLLFGLGVAAVVQQTWQRRTRRSGVLARGRRQVTRARRAVADSLCAGKEKLVHARDEAVSSANERPLLVALAVLVAGAVIGASVPTSRKEDELLGPHRDRLLDEARAKADDVLELASSAVAGEASASRRVMTSADVERELDALRRESERSRLPSSGGSQPH
jgi:hypothetical protein